MTYEEALKRLAARRTDLTPWYMHYDKRAAAALQYGTAQGSLSRAINCLTKIRDYAPRD